MTSKDKASPIEHEDFHCAELQSDLVKCIESRFKESKVIGLRHQPIENNVEVGTITISYIRK